jgi:hypothetical protein
MIVRPRSRASTVERRKVAIASVCSERLAATEASVDYRVKSKSAVPSKVA